MKKLEYVSDWNGGRYQLNDFGHAGVVSLSEIKAFWLKPEGYSGTQINVELYKTSGVDHDHGHQYDWTRVDASLKLNVMGVDVKVPLMEFIQQGVIYVEV